MRELVMALYVIGCLVTMAGVFRAYRRARRDLTKLESIGEMSSAHEATDFVELFNATATGDDARLEASRSSEIGVQAEVDRRIADIGLEPGGVDQEDLRMPLEYWAKRSALRDAVSSFRGGGIIALVGLAISTIASIWSLYLPVG